VSDRFHDDYRRSHEVKSGSDRSFGFVFCAIFVIIGLWPLLSSEGPRLWSLVIAAGFLGVALLRPVLLSPLNRLWFKFGLLLNKVVNPLIMGLVFYITVTPIGLIMRVLGKDLLGLRLSKDSESYWIHRDPPGPSPESMRQQF